MLDRIGLQRVQLADEISAYGNDRMVLVVQPDAKVSVDQTLVFRDGVDGDEMRPMDADELRRVKAFFQVDQRGADDELAV